MARYSSMRPGVISLVKGAWKEYPKTGITVNGLAPAVIRTAMNKARVPEQVVYMTAKIPIGRLGTVEGLAAMSIVIILPGMELYDRLHFRFLGGRAAH